MSMRESPEAMPLLRWRVRHIAACVAQSWAGCDAGVGGEHRC